MVVFWFLLALVLLAVALVLLRLDARQRGGASRSGPGAAVDAAPVGEETGSDDDEAPPLAPPAGEDDRPRPDRVNEPGIPQLAPFQRAAGHDVHGAGEGTGSDVSLAQGRSVHPEAVDGPAGSAAETGPERAAQPAAGSAPDRAPDRAADQAVDPASPAAEPGAEPTAVSAPRLLDRVRGLLPARRQTTRLPESAPAPVDPLADSPVVRWLEDRAFEPTPTPAPEFRHGDFAGGLSALGTVSHGMFRGRRAIMGVTGGRTVLALRRDTSSDVVLDLSRPDVDAEPGFHDAGEVAALEARTSDYGRLDLIDRDRLASAVLDVPALVRRIWAESEWVAATLDGTDDPSTWDDVVVALHVAADALAPFPPIGGRARALPTEIDPGSPGGAAGPEADPTVGMDGEIGTGTHGVAPASAALTTASPETPTPASASTPTPTAAPTTEAVPADADAIADADAGTAVRPETRRAGHLRLVPDRAGARDLADAPVVADRGDTDAGSQPDPEPDAGADAAAADESDPFDEIMEPTGPVEARGDVAADFLEPRPPLSRPTRGTGQAYPDDATVPPLAAGVATGGAGIKPLGSEDDEDEIRTEVERFDAARIDGGSDLDAGSGGRHAQPSADETPVWLRPDVAPAPRRAGSGKHRRAEPEDEEISESGRERPGVEPDVEQTTRIQMPPGIWE